MVFVLPARNQIFVGEFDQQRDISDPNCSEGSPVGLHCVVVLPRQPYRQAEAECRARKMKLWPGPDQDLSQVKLSNIFSAGKLSEIFSPQINEKIYAELDTEVWVKAETESLYSGTGETQTVTIAGKYQMREVKMRSFLFCFWQMEGCVRPGRDKVTSALRTATPGSTVSASWTSPPTSSSPPRRLT